MKNVICFVVDVEFDWYILLMNENNKVLLAYKSLDALSSKIMLQEHFL